MTKNQYGITPEGLKRIAQVTLHSPKKYKDEAETGEPSSILPKTPADYLVEEKVAEEDPDFDSMSDEEFDAWVEAQPDYEEEAETPQEEYVETASDFGRSFADKNNVQL